MKNRTYWALGVLVLLIIFGICYVIGNRFSEPEQTEVSPSETEQLEVQARPKLPPLGENYATGHWEGDVWHRTAPPEPDTVMHEGKAMTLRELLRAARGKSWEEEVAILNRIIAEAPYSKTAFYARSYLAKYDENRERIWDNALLFERLQPLVNYHPDSPGLLCDLLMHGMHIYPKAAIHYGTEALKYVGRYGVGVGHSAYPEKIHHYLGYAYQLVGNYDTALEHLNQALNLYIRERKAVSLSFKIREQIEQIQKENPILGSFSDGPTLAEKMARKLPPPGETFATGYWDGNKWHRTVPPGPETITYAGKALPLRKLYQAAFYFEKSWEKKVVILNLIIAEAPYSNEAFEARYYLATRDENGERIRDDALVIERLEPLLKYHPDSSFLLHALLLYSRHSHPEAAIGYGKEALKYVDMLRFDSNLFTSPEYIHYHLGELYQEIGDYSTALAHLNQSLKICKTVERDGMFTWGSEDLVRKYRDRILAGDPALGPLSTTGLVAPVAAPVSAPVISE